MGHSLFNGRNWKHYKRFRKIDVGRKNRNIKNSEVISINFDKNKIKSIIINNHN